MKRRPRNDPSREGAAPGQPPPRHALWFVGRFIGALALGQLALAWFSPVEGWAVRNTLDSLDFVAGCLRLPGGVVGASFHVGPSHVQIVSECTPLLPALVLTAAIVAYPAVWTAQIVGILAGAVVIWAFNLLRIGALMAVLAWRPGSFDFVHMYLWQPLTLFVVLAIFIVWLRLQPSRREV